MYTNIYEVCEAYKRGEKLEYCFFWGHTPSKNGEVTSAVFSQWYSSVFTHDKATYQNMEQYMMAGKARLFNDEEIFNRIMEIEDPKTIKALGRKVKNFSEDVWKKHRVDIVTKGNVAKFSQDEKLKSYLLGTGEKILVEASPYDRIWGIGLSSNAKNIEDPNQWRGLNLLGFALMQARDFLKRNE